LKLKFKDMGKASGDRVTVLPSIPAILEKSVKAYSTVSLG
jgi:hypothetical protein